MTVTITIRDNDAYCAERGLRQPQVALCLCRDQDGRPDNDCPGCCGNGFVIYHETPYQLNLANANFATLWSALGLDAERGEGEIAAADLRDALRRFDPARAERAAAPATILGLPGFDCGLHRPTVERRTRELQALTTEAMRRQQPIVWC